MVKELTGAYELIPGQKSFAKKSLKSHYQIIYSSTFQQRLLNFKQQAQKFQMKNIDSEDYGIL